MVEEYLHTILVFNGTRVECKDCGHKGTIPIALYGELPIVWDK